MLYSRRSADKGRQFRATIFSAISVAVFVAAIAAIAHIAMEFDVGLLFNALATMPAWKLFLAALFTAASYVVLSGYDWSALIYLNRRLPYRTIALATFCGCAVANSVGANLLSGGSVRYRIYVPAGLNGFDVARVTVFGMVAFSLGTSVVVAAALSVYPELFADYFHLSPYLLKDIGMIGLLCSVGLVVVTFLKQTPFNIGPWKIRLPSGPITVAQLLVSVVDIAFAGACLYILLPAQDLPLLPFLVVYTVAVVAGMISHVPGGLGVFESIVLISFKHVMPAESLAAALLLYRGIYYLAPLIIASIILVSREVFDRTASD